VRRKDKVTALSELHKMSEATDISPVRRLLIAHFASGLGDPELAFEIFIKSADAPGAMWHPIHRAIWQLPAFKNYVRDIGLYEYWRASGNWGDNCRPVSDDDFVCD
jgi:hypothetical protein